MNVVDSSGWIEFFANGPNAAFFAAPLARVESLVVPTISMTEVFRHVLRERDEQSALLVVAAMHQGTIVSLDAELALAAARIGVQLRIPLADSIILATARSRGATLWTQDADFEGQPGVRFVAKAT